jgi:hypothetical protein
MINLFKKFFQDKNNKSVTYTENVKQNKITFSIDQWDRMTIDINFENQDVSCVETFGKILYNMNHGVYEDKILECLVTLSKTNPVLIPSIQKVLTTWGIMVINKDPGPDKNHSPFIKPTSVFK